LVVKPGWITLPRPAALPADAGAELAPPLAPPPLLLLFELEQAATRATAAVPATVATMTLRRFIR
jgi:hypothetical protein